ncbi:MAG: hypothetical protein QM658_13555 [Gordonia sp. (in: high G+C Gram-positive bacteria)]
MFRTSRTLRSAVALIAGLVTAAGAVGAGAGTASADPYQGKNYVKTIRCGSADPWGGAPLSIYVDVYNKVAFPSDGLPGPAIDLVASNPRSPSIIPNLTEYNVETTVRWRNVTTGRAGTVRVPTRSTRAGWEAVIHPGRGKVNFRIEQKIGALLFVPMVNPQTSHCSGSAISS